MDPHTRWFRRYVLLRALTRVVVEATLGGLAVGAVAVVGGAAPVDAAILGCVVVPPAGALRLVLALTVNPISSRYLDAWADPTGRLRALAGRSPADPGLARELSRLGLRHVLRLEAEVGPTDDRSGERRHDGGAPDGRAPDDGSDGEGLDDPVDGVDVFLVEGGLVAAAVADGELAILSRLSDGRILVTASGLVPPSGPLAVNRSAGGGVEALTTAHVDALDGLGRSGVVPVAAGPDVALDQLRAEWAAWQDLGPVAGPLVSVGPGRASPLRLEVSVPAAMVWERTRTAPPDLWGGDHHRSRGGDDRRRPGSGGRRWYDRPERSPVEVG